MSHWPYLSEGDQRWLELLAYHEAAPCLRSSISDPYGTYGTSGYAKIPYGGIVFKGQIRAVGHDVKPISYAIGFGNPADPHWVMCRDMFDHWKEMNEAIVIEEDAWRGGLDRTDGRRFQDLKLIWPNNEPSYKLWMHSFGLHGLSYAYGISEYAPIKERADWWSHCLVVMSGGYHNDVGAQYNLMKPDPLTAASYNTLAIRAAPGRQSRIAATGIWASGSPTQRMHLQGGQSDALVCRTDAGHHGNDGRHDHHGHRSQGGWITLFAVTTMAPIPGLLTRNIPYYAVQCSGNTCKISLSPGGSPVTFNSGGADIVGVLSGRRSAACIP